MSHQPRSNRVSPFGALEAVPARGQLMGNRGDLHDRQGMIVRDWKVKRWIACRLTHPRGLLATFDTPGRYTPLFFADEPTALAAGHRPCAECRREDYEAYRQGWTLAFGSKPLADDLDNALHAARMSHTGEKIVFEARLEDLPDGVFVTQPGFPHIPYLLWQGGLHPWAHQGYGRAVPAPRGANYSVLTPSPSVAVLAALASDQASPWPGFVGPRLDFTHSA